MSLPETLSMRSIEARRRDSHAINIIDEEVSSGHSLSAKQTHHQMMALSFPK